MIISEKEHIGCKMPENLIEQLRQIKKASLVISPDEIVSHVIFYFRLFLIYLHIIERTEGGKFVRTKSIQSADWRDKRIR